MQAAVPFLKLALPTLYLPQVVVLLKLSLFSSHHYQIILIKLSLSSSYQNH